MSLWGLANFMLLVASILSLLWPCNNLSVCLHSLLCTPRNILALQSSILIHTLTIHSTNSLCQHCYSSNFPNTKIRGTKLSHETSEEVGAMAIISIKCLSLAPSSLFTCHHEVFSYSDAPKPLILNVFICICLFIICICVNGPESWSIIFLILLIRLHVFESTECLIYLYSPHHY